MNDLNLALLLSASTGGTHATEFEALTIGPATRPLRGPGVSGPAPAEVSKAGDLDFSVTRDAGLLLPQDDGGTRVDMTAAPGSKWLCAKPSGTTSRGSVDTPVRWGGRPYESGPVGRPNLPRSGGRPTVAFRPPYSAPGSAVQAVGPDCDSSAGDTRRSTVSPPLVVGRLVRDDLQLSGGHDAP